MAAPLWAQALKGVADLGTVVGNGLAFGRGEDLKQTLGWGVQNSGRALGLVGGDYVPLKNYLAQGADELAAARQATGTVGSLAETGAGLVGAGLGGAALVKGARALPSILPKLSSVIPAAKGLALPALGAATAYGVAGSGTTPQDFADKPAQPAAASSATTGPQAGSKQKGPAAVSGEADWSPAKKHFVDTMSSIPLSTLRQAMELEQIGAPRPPMPRDAAFQQLTNMLGQQYVYDAQTDEPTARATYIRNMTSLIQPSGVMYMNPGLDGSQ